MDQNCPKGDFGDGLKIPVLENSQGRKEMFENGLTSGISLKRLIMPAERRFFNRLVGIMNYYDILFYIVLIISILLMFDALKKNREKVNTKLYTILLIINIFFVILIKYEILLNVLTNFEIDIFTDIFLIIILIILLVTCIGLLYIPISARRKGHDEN